MSTDIVTRLVCENCGHIFEPGEVGYFIEGEEALWTDDKVTYQNYPLIHPTWCPNCHAKIINIVTPDNAFKRLVSHSALEHASAIDTINSATHVTIEKSRMRFERNRKRKSKHDPVQLPIAITVEFDWYFSFQQFLDIFGINERNDDFCSNVKANLKTSLTLKEIRKIATDNKGSMRYCVPGSGDRDKFLEAHEEKWIKSGLEECCGYFNMKKKDMIFNFITISPIKGDPKYKVIFNPFYFKQKEN